MKKLLNKKAFLITAIIFVGFLFLYWQDNDIVITEFQYCNGKIPKEFDNFTIAQISDLHNKEFGAEQKYILERLESTSPDIIVITGDLIDRRNYDLKMAITFVKKAVKLAPVYYVSGNHEVWSGKYDIIRNELINSGVNVLDNKKVKLTKGGGSISLMGLKDPGFLDENHSEGTDTSAMETQLQKWSSQDGFKILLSHRPQFMDLYKKCGMDMVFSGHTHGGQIRLPFIGALIVPDQGVFPKYVSGKYHEDNTDMFISRGLGTSLIPIRLFNRPQILTVTLKSVK